MIYSELRFVALHLFTRARASHSDFAGVASVLQPLARLGFRGDNCASAACRRSPHGSPEAWKGWLAARRPSRPPVCSIAFELRTARSRVQTFRRAHRDRRWTHIQTSADWHLLYASSEGARAPATKRRHHCCRLNARAQRAAAAAL